MMATSRGPKIQLSFKYQSAFWQALTLYNFMFQLFLSQRGKALS